MTGSWGGVDWLVCLMRSALQLVSASDVELSCEFFLHCHARWQEWLSKGCYKEQNSQFLGLGDLLVPEG